MTVNNDMNFLPISDYDHELLLKWRHTLQKLPSQYFSTVEVTPEDSIKYMYRFYDYLYDVHNIPNKYWIPNLIVNELYTPEEFVDITEIRIIDSTIIDELLKKEKQLSTYIHI